MDGVGIDLRLGSSTKGGEERERADTSLRMRVEVEESSTRAGCKNSGGRLAGVPDFCKSGELLSSTLFGETC